MRTACGDSPARQGPRVGGPDLFPQRLSSRTGSVIGTTLTSRTRGPGVAPVVLSVVEQRLDTVRAVLA